jgi:chemotaxis protein MotB
MKRTPLWLASLLILTLPSCVSKKKYLEALKERDQVRIEVERVRNQLETCNDKVQLTETQMAALRGELDYWKLHSTNLLERLSQLAILSQSEAENVRKSLDKIDEQDQYIKKLTAAGTRKDSLNLALVTNLKRSLGNFDDSDIQISVKKGVVYVSISDRMLFKTGSAVVSADAKNVLGKLAQVINSQPHLEIMVEGHTDNVPISNEQFADNWALSVARASSIIRILQKDYKVAPERLVAAGRGEFSPKTSNETTEGRSLNRRTEIILVPKIDEFFELVTPKEEEKGTRP